MSSLDPSTVKGRSSRPRASTPASISAPISAPNPELAGRLVRNEGQRLLALARAPLTEVARVCGVSKQAVSQWRNGLSVPSSAMRRRLGEVYRIPPDAWGLRPSTASAAPLITRSSSAPAPLPTRGASVAAPPSSAEELSPPHADSLTECRRLHAQLRVQRDQPGLHPSELVHLAKAELRVLVLRHRLETNVALADDDTVRNHPNWQQLKRCITRAVAGCARCAKAIAEELARLGM
jgi:transcriptional regulator with XRE-family HTH domain